MWRHFFGTWQDVEVFAAKLTCYGKVFVSVLSWWSLDDATRLQFLRLRRCFVLYQHLERSAQLHGVYGDYLPDRKRVHDHGPLPGGLWEPYFIALLSPVKSDYRYGGIVDPSSTGLMEDIGVPAFHGTIGRAWHDPVMSLLPLCLSQNNGGSRHGG